MLLREQRAPQGIALGILQGRFVPEIRGVSARGIRLTNRAHARAGLLAEALQVFICEAPFHFDVIHLAKVLPMLEHRSGQVAVIGEKHETRRGIVEPPNGINALRQAAQKRSEEHTSELQSPCNLVCRLLLEKKKTNSSHTRHV